MVSRFQFNATSERRLSGVHPDLVRVVRESVHLLEMYGELVRWELEVVCGGRTEEEQQAYLAAGMSRTLDSKHLRQRSGYFEAVDLMPVLLAQARWEEHFFFKIALVMQLSAIKLDVKITWGGVWDRPLNDLSDDLRNELRLYRQRYYARKPRPKDGPFFDGPHFQLA